LRMRFWRVNLRKGKKIPGDPGEKCVSGGGNFGKRGNSTNKEKKRGVTIGLS